MKVNEKNYYFNFMCCDFYTLLRLYRKKAGKIENITVEQALQFSNELKELEKKNYDVSNRLIVSANKKIDTMGAVATATGVENIYVLQYNSKEATEKAYEYYNSVSGINYVEYDQEENLELCESQENNDFNVNCNSTVNCNIDDAIKLMKQENVEFSKIAIGVVDSGISLNGVTEPRFSGGHTAIYNYPENGTYDGLKHGTYVAGTIILNTPENVKVRSYQGFNEEERSTITGLSSMMMLAIAEGCKVINCSFINHSSIETFKDITDYANEKNVIMVCSAGNRGRDLDELDDYPAKNEGAITVGACSPTNGYYKISNFGKYVDIFAPGEKLTRLTIDGNWQYKVFSGTSASAPVISSICALLILIEPQIIYSEIEDILQLTGNATNEENCTSPEKVIADAYAAVKYLLDAELESCSLDYTVSKSNQMSLTDISLSSNEGAEIYYSILDEENIYYPFDGPDANKYSENLEKECLKDGYTVYICTECGYTYTGHQITATYYETSCDMYEHIDYKCENCSYSYTEILSYVLLPHDTYTVGYLAPTEDHTGRAYTYCKNCDTVLPDTVIPSLAPYSVTGKIVAAEDRDMHTPNQYPVAGAHITVNDELVAVTDENGEFLSNFGNGTYTAYVTYSNGLDTSFTFTVDNASTEIESAVPIVACD